MDGWDKIPTGSTPIDFISQQDGDGDLFFPFSTAEVAQDRVISPEGEKQVINQDDPAVLIVSEEQGLSREGTEVENNQVIQPTRVKVKFDDTSGASYDKSYSGPLISSEQLAFSGEDLTDVMFCKHYNASVTGRESSASEVASKNYLECAESILEQGIKRWLSSYNEQVAHSSGAKIVNLVTFREALQHAARLSRALVRMILIFYYSRDKMTDLSCNFLQTFFAQITCGG